MTKDELTSIIRSTGYATYGQSVEIAELILSKVPAPVTVNADDLPLRDAPMMPFTEWKRLAERPMPLMLKPPEYVPVATVGDLIDSVRRETIITQHVRASDTLYRKVD